MEYKMFTFPWFTPVTVPEEETGATPGSALDQVPFNVELAKVIIEPIFTDDNPVILFIAGNVFTIVEIEFEEAGLPIAHALSEVKVAYTASPFDKSVVEYIAAVCPEITEPFLYHAYTGLEPPFVGVAENVLFVPAHIVEEVLEIEVETTEDVDTIISTVFVVVFKPPQPAVIVHL
jgi:hypothetical protein